MTSLLGYPAREYHKQVNRPARRSFQATLRLLGMLLFPVLVILNSWAQVGNSSSSNSAHSAPVPAASHYSAPAPSVTHPPTSPRTTSGSGNSNTHPHPKPSQSSSGMVYYPYLYAVPFPYAVDESGSDVSSGSDNSDNSDADDQGGPTIFDRRGSGADSYVPPTSDDPPTVAQSIANPATDSPQLPTILVFKDGHQLEVDNYAIVGQTLYDLTPGHARRVALADLDLSATQKQNDDRGVSFQPPSSAQAN